MWITNVPGYYIPTGFHPDPGPNSILIQIGNPDQDTTSLEPDFPIPSYPFKEIHQFRFHDLTDDNVDEMPEDQQSKYRDGLISDQQAQNIAKILVSAYEGECNVIVHCSAGICRSGAVTEVAVMMGFRDIHQSRSPNLMVKRKLIEQLMALNWFQ